MTKVASSVEAQARFLGSGSSRVLTSVGLSSLASPLVSSGADVWIVEAGGTIAGSGDHAGINDVTTFTLEATAAGVRLYEQLGFKTVAQPSVFVVGSSTQFST